MNDMNIKRAATGFYAVYGFMERELGLRSSTLRVYAILFSYTNGSAGMYFGTRKYLADALSISVRTLHRALSELFSRGLIENFLDSSSGRSGIRCSCVHEGERASGSSEDSKSCCQFGEEEKNRALDNIVRKRYGDLPKELHMATRAAIRDKMDRDMREREVREAVQRITRIQNMRERR